MATLRQAEKSAANAAPPNPIERAGETTITGKNQISLPAEAVRRLGWQKGDRLLVSVQHGELVVLMRRPADWAGELAGRFSDIFGAHDENLRYLEEERRGWDEE